MKTANAPTIDAEIGDGCWVGADWASSFIEVMGKSGAQFPTEVALCHDDRNLYAVFRCNEPNTGDLLINRERKTHDDQVWQDDCVELFISPEGNDTYFQFMVNALGVRGETKNKKAGWDGSWQGAATVSDRTWLVEMAIPFATLGVKPPREDDVWRLNFGRERRCKGPGEDSTWSPTFGSFHNTTRFGRVVFAKKSAESQQGTPRITSVRLLKPLETGTNPLEIKLASEGRRNLKIVVERTIRGRKRGTQEKELSVEGESSFIFPMKANRTGPFFAAIRLFEDGKLLEEKYMSGMVARSRNVRGEHPRLYFGSDDTEALHKKMQHPSHKRDWAAIMKSAEAALEGPPIDEGRPSQVLSRAARCR